MQFDDMQLLYPLADSVQFSLYLCREKKGDVGKIRGHGEFALPISDNRELSIKCKVVASGIEKSAAFILFTVTGDLLLLMTYDHVMREVSLSAVDASALEGDAYLTCSTVKAIYDAVLPAVRGMWIRQVDNEEWSRLDAVDSMDDPTIAPAEEDHRTMDSGIQSLP